MSIIETAKELIEKGIQLGDDELVKMGKNLLAQNEEVREEIPVDFTDATVPNVAIELAPPIKKETEHI